MKKAKEKAKNICNEMAETAQRHLDLKRWGFQESSRLPYHRDLYSMDPVVIYNSEMCKFKVQFTGWVRPYSTEYTISTFYGRLHAPDSVGDIETMIWNGEKCHPWIHARETLHFLDGSTPEYAAKNKIYQHELITEYRKDNKGKGFSNLEWVIRIDAMLWKHYASKLFELFDLRRPELWEEYRIFLKEAYRIKTENSQYPVEHSPPFWQVC